MANVGDIHNFDDQFQYQLDKLDEADIDDRDRKAIKDLIRYQDTQRGLAASTNVNNCSDLRLSAERADTPLVDMDREGVDALLFEYKHNYDMAKGTLRNYRKAFRKFFRYHDREWTEDIEIGAIPDRDVDADKTLTEDEISALRESADHPRNKALLEMVIDTWLRISAVGTLRVQDVDLNGQAGTVTLNQEALGRKGARGKRPLTWRNPYVANCLDVHPRRDDPDAPLFHRLTEPNGGWDEDEDGCAHLLPPPAHPQADRRGGGRRSRQGQPPQLSEDCHHPVDPPGLQRAGDQAPSDLGQGQPPVRDLQPGQGRGDESADPRTVRARGGGNRAQ